MSQQCAMEGLPEEATRLVVVVRCAEHIGRRARYVLDSLFAAAGIVLAYRIEPPAAGPWLLYAPDKSCATTNPNCVAVAHVEGAWELFDGQQEVFQSQQIRGLDTVFAQRRNGFETATDIDFDIVANAFYFLSSWPERSPESDGRKLHSRSIYAKLGIAQDIVDRYLMHLTARLRRVFDRLGLPAPTPARWPDGAAYAVVLSHDVDFLPAGQVDILRQGAKSVLRHLVRQRDPADAWRALTGLLRALAGGQDPYGCVPALIEGELLRGVRSSFQVAVANRHPNDVNYRIEDDKVRDYLRAITDAGFDLCLHGSYRSSESGAWYVAEAELLGRRLMRPRGSRQHFLSFDYDSLFAAQEAAGIRYDMSMGFPDHVGPRAGFSYPYFPYCIEEDRPYNVLQISLFLMDVTLRSYMRLRPEPAWQVIAATLDDLRSKAGCASVVWHPIVFGGARDPGYDDLYWRLVEHISSSGGLATDGRSIDHWWRRRCAAYASFSGFAGMTGPSTQVQTGHERAAWQMS